MGRPGYVLHPAAAGQRLPPAGRGTWTTPALLQGCPHAWGAQPGVLLEALSAGLHWQQGEQTAQTWALNAREPRS